jgi:6-phosphogluconolactonase/glucosamine-6-phosphate isomerase/deaminase
MSSRMLSSAVTPAVPASLLQLHPSVTYVLDEEAAANL